MSVEEGKRYKWRQGRVSFVQGEWGDLRKLPKGGGGGRSRDATTFSSPEEPGVLRWPLTRATGDLRGEPERVARLRPSPGGTLDRRTERVYVPPTTEDCAPLVPPQLPKELAKWCSFVGRGRRTGVGK